MSDSPNPRPQVGPLAAMFIIVAIFALGGAYFFYEQRQALHERQLQAAAAANS